MKRKVMVLALLSVVLVFLTGCQKYTDDDYLKLQSEYAHLEHKYNSLNNDYIDLERSTSSFMNADDVAQLSDFAHHNSFRGNGFYSTAYCVVLKTGGSTTIYIGFDEYGTLTYESDNRCATAEWGDWDYNDREAFTLTGCSQGITYFTITNSVDDRSFEIVVFVLD